MKPKMSLDVWLHCSYAVSKSDRSIYPWSSATYRWLFTSVAEANATFRKFLNSFRERRSNPSAMFAITETAARCIWLLRPKSLANVGRLVNEYTRFVSSLACCQALISSNRSIFMGALYQISSTLALRTGNFALGTSYFELRTSNFELRTSHFALRTVYHE